MTVTGTDVKTLRFTYDTNGHPATVTYGDNIYYYITNLQGDVIAILDGSRNSVVEYTYNAWGQVMSVTGTMANSLGQLNPLRYRGYVYDTESGLYYLQSRYYDPDVGRFINADALASIGQGLLGYNMFSYCLNNPVNYTDPSGEFALVDDIVFISTSTIVVIALILIPPVPVLDTVLTGLTKATAAATEAFSYAANILTAKTKGKERVKDTGLAQESDAEISQKAHDKTLPKSEQRRYQTEEKARGLRNRQKRLDLYQ